MSILESLHHYSAGTLITLKDGQLGNSWMVLNEKIKYLETVIHAGNFPPETLDDMRLYEAAKDEIAKLIEQRRIKQQYA